MTVDPDRIAGALTQMLRERKLPTEARGWVDAQVAAQALAHDLGIEVQVVEVLDVARGHEPIEVRDGRIRSRRKPPRADRPTVDTPDILYHACTQDQVDRYLDKISGRV